MDEAVSDTERNTCATSYVTAVNWRPMAYVILKFIFKWKDKDWYDVYFIPKIKLYIV
jgi:hypothetical protein